MYLCPPPCLLTLPIIQSLICSKYSWHPRCFLSRPSTLLTQNLHTGSSLCLKYLPLISSLSPFKSCSDITLSMSSILANPFYPLAVSLSPTLLHTPTTAQLQYKLHFEDNKNNYNMIQIMRIQVQISRSDCISPNHTTPQYEFLKSIVVWDQGIVSQTDTKSLKQHSIAASFCSICN